MRFFHKTKIRFMEYRWYWIIASTALNLVAIGLIFFGPGFKYGVDFAGGTQLTLKHSGLPEGQGPGYKSGWGENYFDPMREYFA